MTPDQERGILKNILEQGEKAFAEPETAFVLMTQKSAFKDDLIRFACSALLLEDGNWKTAKETVRSNRDLDKERVRKLIAWADRIWVDKSSHI